MQSRLTVVQTGPGEYGIAAPEDASGALNTFAQLNVTHHKARTGSSKEGPAIGCIVVHQLAVVQQSPAVPLQHHRNVNEPMSRTVASRCPNLIVIIRINYDKNNNDMCQPGLGACGGSLSSPGRLVLSDLIGTGNRFVRITI